MSKIEGNANINESSNTDNQEQNSDNAAAVENTLSAEQQKVIDLCARERVLQLREKEMAEREIKTYATECLRTLGFTEEQKELAFKIINFGDSNTCKMSIEIISQICEARALDIVNSKLRSVNIPKAFIPCNQTRTPPSTFQKEIQNLKSR